MPGLGEIFANAFKGRSAAWADIDAEYKRRHGVTPPTVRDYITSGIDWANKNYGPKEWNRFDNTSAGLASDLTQTLEDTTPIGAVTAAGDTDRALADKDYLGAGLAALGLIPGAKPVKNVAETAVKTAAKELPEIMATATKPKITAYHGTPHDFDKFKWDSTTRGTGEGAQAYGDGLYFAENEDIARSYRDALAPENKHEMEMYRFIQDAQKYRREGKPVDIDFIREHLGYEANPAIAGLKDDPRAVRAMMTAIQHDLGGGAVSEETLDAYRYLSATVPKNKGHMYEVNINADPEHFLDWDKPLAEQQAWQKIRDDWDKNLGDPDIIQERFGIDPSRSTGSDYVNLSTTDRAAVSQRLKEQGIPGIKFLDAGSRREGTGSRNFVVFDDKIIDIVKKYGIVGALSAGLISEEMARQMQAQGMDERPET